jgi:hypothetical protein
MITKLNSDVISASIVIIVSGALMYSGYLGIFDPKKIVDHYSSDSTAFMRRVRAEGLTKKDLLHYKLSGVLSMIMGAVILFFNINNILNLFL